MTPRPFQCFLPALLAATLSLLTACGGGDSTPRETASTTAPVATERVAAAFSGAAVAGTDYAAIAAGPALNTDTNVLTVRARGVLAGNIGPIVELRIDGVSIGTVEVRSSDYDDYRFSVPPLKPGSKVDLIYANDAVVAGVDRNLFVAQLSSGNTAVLSTDAQVQIDRGLGSAALDGQDVLPGQAALVWNGAFRITWPSPNLVDSLVVRASGRLAGGVGPTMLVRVDGIVVGSTEVRSTTPADHVFAVPALKPGSRVDVAYTNHEVIGSETRSLDVAYLLSGTTVVLPATAGLNFDQGSGAAAFDSVNLVPGKSSLTTNGALRAKWPSPNMTDTLTVRASGTPAGGTGPLMQVRVDGVVVGTVEVRATSPIDLSFQTLPLRAGSQLDVAFLNNAVVNGEDRNLHVQYLIAGKTYLLPTMPGVLFDAGSGAAAFDGLATVAGTSTLASNGALRAAWPAPNLTGTLTVRAKGTLAGGVGPVMQLWVDGVAVGSVEVRATEFADHVFAIPQLHPGSKVDLAFTNDAIVDGEDRNLHVAYLISGTTFLLPGSAGVSFDRGVGAAAFDGADLIPPRTVLFWGGALRSTWPEPNLTSSVTLRASGTLVDGVGPTVQLVVDGVIVGSTELRSSEPADYVFAVPALKPGMRVEVIQAASGAAQSASRSQLTAAYLIAGTTVLQANASGDIKAAWPAPNLTDSLVVRASGILAGGVGPIVQLRVDGVIVGSQEVRSSEYADYRFSVPPLKPGSKVDLIYANDAVVGGVDRNLFVAQLSSGTTALLSTDAQVQIDRGLGSAALDGQDVLPGQAGLVWNGALRTTWPSPNLVDSLVVRASGRLAGGIGPTMLVRVDGIVVGSTEVRATTPTDHVFAVPALKPGSRVDVVYTNHEVIGGETRGLDVAYLLSGTTVVLPTNNGVNFDQGSGTAAFDSANLLPGQSSLTTNGALRAKWPNPNMTDTLTVRASGTLAGGTGPLMQVRVDGVVVGTVEVRATSPTDLSFQTLPLRAGSQIDVAFLNDAVVNGEDRNLNVQYLIAGKTYLLPTMPGVLFDAGSGAAAFDGLATVAGTSTLASNGALRAAWPAPNLTDTLTVRAKGTLAGGVGPVMQLWVDGVAVGSVEVRATEFADHAFAIPQLHPGSKVDVAFTNDALVNGENRDLHVAYLVSGNTFVLPTHSGVIYDRGAGRAAFDGVDTLAGRNTLGWNGSLRAVWPAANITSSVTVRASGTLAGNVGPIMQIQVDGVAVSAVEVRSPQLADYVMAVPPLRPGSKIDVVYSNDAIISGVDRNLNVAYLSAGSTFVLANASGVQYDLGHGAAAFDGVDVQPGRSSLGSNGALRLTWPAPNVTDTLTVRASGTLVDNVGPLMQLRVNGVILGTVEVRSASGADYAFKVPSLPAGSRIDIAFINDAHIGSADRNLFVQYLKFGNTVLTATAPTVQMDVGYGEAAFDGSGTGASSGALYDNGALRFTVPAQPAPDALLPAKYAASRFLQQATFGPTAAEIQRLATVPYATWMAEQMAMPPRPDFVNHVQAKYDLGDDYRPGGKYYTPTWVGQRFWSTAATSPDQLRKRVAFALHQIFMVSQADSNLYNHSRAYANYLDTLNLHAFGNFRTLLEEVSMNPAMGIYLSHLRNRREDAATGRLPDENFARELMQLFTIGLQELNLDGTPRLDSRGNPIESYSNEDVMALAKVFTGFSWGVPDAWLTDAVFRWGTPDYSAANDLRIDLQKLKPYPGQHSTVEKRLFQGKAHAITLSAGNSAQDDLRLALDGLFNHPNVGPFISRQLIQRLVTSQPSPAYVARVAAKFNNNGSGVRGDLAAVVRAILLDSEARQPAGPEFGKVREPVLRVTQWMRAFGATSVSGDFMMGNDLDGLLQRPMYAASVFSYFRPGYVPPNTALAASNATAPEFQIVSESTTAQWVNLAESMAGSGVGWNGAVRDIASSYAVQLGLLSNGQADDLLANLNLLLFDGRMSAALRLELLQAMTSIYGTTPTSQINRVRVAVFLALSSPEYLVQR